MSSVPVLSIPQTIPKAPDTAPNLRTAAGLHALDTDPSDVLRQRGIEQAARDAGWADGPNPYNKQQPGWRYPVFDLEGNQVEGLVRWKAADSANDPKYTWSPKGFVGRPKLYTLPGLREATQAMHGDLHVTSGEPDLLTMRMVGIQNVMCAFGETSLPTTPSNDLHTLSANRVIYWRDRNATGLKAAIKIRDLLLESSISFECRRLPGQHDDKHDLNDEWQECKFDAATFLAVLAASEVEVLPPPAPKPPLHPYVAPASVKAEDRARRWATAYARRRLNELAATPDGGRNLALYPAAFALGQLAGEGLLNQAEIECQLLDLARQLEQHAATVRSGIKGGLSVAPEWVPDFNRPLPMPRRNVDGLRKSARVELAAFPRYFPGGLPRDLFANDVGLGALRVHLNLWFHVAPRDVPNLGAMVAFLFVFNEMVLAGDIDPDRGATVHFIIEHNRRGLSRAACEQGAELAVAFELCEFCVLESSSSLLGHESSRNSPANTRGRPASVIRMKPLDQALAGYFSRLGVYAWRALLVREYPDLPVEAGDLADLLMAREGATWGDIATMDDVCQPLFEQCHDVLQKATGHLYRRLAYIRQICQADAILRGEYEALVLSDGVKFSNAAQFRDAIDAADPDLRDGERADRYRAANRTGRTLAAHKRSCERREIVPVPVWSKLIPINPDADTLPQAASVSQEALNRGRMKLRAPDGAEIDLSAKAAEFRNYDAWLDDHGGKNGATLSTWERTIEKHETALTQADRDLRAEISDRQKDHGKRCQGTRADGKPCQAKAVKKTDFCPSHAEQRAPKQNQVMVWYQAQGEMRAGFFNLQPMPKAKPKIYMANDQIFEAARVWTGIITMARALEEQISEEEAAMPTFAVHCEPHESDPPAHEPVENRAEEMRSRFTDTPPGSGVGDFAPEGAENDTAPVCEYCGGAAHHQNFMGGWRCAEHQAAPIRWDRTWAANYLVRIQEAAR